MSHSPYKCVRDDDEIAFRAWETLGRYMALLAGEYGRSVTHLVGEVEMLITRRFNERATRLYFD